MGYALDASAIGDRVVRYSVRWRLDTSDLCDHDRSVHCVLVELVRHARAASTVLCGPRFHEDVSLLAVRVRNDRNHPGREDVAQRHLQTADCGIAGVDRVHTHGLRHRFDFATTEGRFKASVRENRTARTHSLSKFVVD